MNELTAALKEELNVDTAFTLPIFGGIDIPESIAVSWGIMAFLVIVSILLTRNLKVNHISKRQAILETAVVTMDNFFKDLLGEAGKQYVPYLITVALYIACSNLIGIIGLKPPTKDLNVTAALAIMSIVLIEYSGIHAKGGKRFVHSLAEPIALMTPMNILEIAIRPTSLCMRLFGNVLGAFVIMELIKLVVPVFVPAIFRLKARSARTCCWAPPWQKAPPFSASLLPCSSSCSWADNGGINDADTEFEYSVDGRQHSGSVCSAAQVFVPSRYERD